MAAKQQKKFYCLRCAHRFLVDVDPKEVVERSCPQCGSNSVRIETAMAAAGRPSSSRDSGKGGSDDH